MYCWSLGNGLEKTGSSDVIIDPSRTFAHLGGMGGRGTGRGREGNWERRDRVERARGREGCWEEDVRGGGTHRRPPRRAAP